jgi:hypothetical protein
MEISIVSIEQYKLEFRVSQLQCTVDRMLLELISEPRHAPDIPL